MTCISTSIYRLLAFVLLFLISVSITHAQTPDTLEADAPFVIENYYKVRWGHAQEFIDLYRKNHYPVLQGIQERGDILSITAQTPRYHGTEDGRWDYRVRIVFRNVVAAYDTTDDAALIQALYPDQDTFQREEQRRFQILEAHWDVPVMEVSLER